MLIVCPKPETRTLLGCMWLQFARAIGGEKSYRICQNCKRWFEIGGGTLGGRPDKRYWDGWQPSPKYRGMLIVCLQSRKRGCVKQ